MGTFLRDSVEEEASIEYLMPWPEPLLHHSLDIGTHIILYVLSDGQIQIVVLFKLQLNHLWQFDGPRL